MNSPVIVDRKEWIESRKALLIKEKSFMESRDKLSAARRQLPWVRVEENYQFEDSNGKHTLSDLFAGKSQLIVQHFMFGEHWDKGCPTCSFWADSFNGAVNHLGARDASFIVVSSARHTDISAYKQRMGWNFEWLSCHGSSFNNDYHVSFTSEQIDSGKIYYNYREVSLSAEELPGISVFVKKENDQIFHTYSSYSRGMDNLNVTYQLLDLLPKGRDEESLEFTMEWVRRHDRYNEKGGR